MGRRAGEYGKAHCNDGKPASKRRARRGFAAPTSTTIGSAANALGLDVGAEGFAAATEANPDAGWDSAGRMGSTRASLTPPTACSRRRCDQYRSE